MAICTQRLGIEEKNNIYTQEIPGRFVFPLRTSRSVFAEEIEETVQIFRDPHLNTFEWWDSLSRRITAPKSSVVQANVHRVAQCREMTLLRSCD